MAKKHNAKMPNTSVCSGDTQPEYGYVFGNWDECGGHSWYYRNPKNHTKTFSQKLEPSGSYNVTQHDSQDKEVHLNLKAGETRSYVGGGKSTQVDGHSDTSVDCTHRIESAGDFGQASGKNYLRGTKNQEIKIKGNEGHFTAKGSAGVVSSGFTGTVRNSFEKDFFNHVQGDIVSMGEKNKITVVKQDYAINAGQNMDSYIKEKGKIETGQTFLLKTGSDATVNSAAKMIIKSGDNTEITSEAEITITADTKITIKVGSSKIEITSSGITIDSSGKLDLKASGDVTTQGSTTKIQGGGPSAPPTTFG